MVKWEYLVVPLDAVGGLKKGAADLRPEHLSELGLLGWEAVPERVRCSPVAAPARCWPARRTGPAADS